MTTFAEIHTKRRRGALVRIESFVKRLLARYLGSREEPRTRSAPTGGEDGAWNFNWMTYKPAEPTYTARHIANYVLDRAADENRPITQLKLQKLVYIAYGWFLALTGRRLFDDPIEAWDHGPVIPCLYHEFKNFGRYPITVRSIDFDIDRMLETEPQVSSEDDETNLVLDRVWESYKRYSGSTLRRKTHEVGSPWFKAYDGINRHIRLDDDVIAEHYRERIADYIEAAKEFAS